MKKFFITVMLGIMAFMGAAGLKAGKQTEIPQDMKVVVHGQETDLNGLSTVMEPVVTEIQERIPDGLKVVVHGHEMNLNDMTPEDLVPVTAD